MGGGGAGGDGDVVRIGDAVTPAAETESTGSIKDTVYKTRTTSSAELPGFHLGLGSNSSLLDINMDLTPARYV